MQCFTNLQEWIAFRNTLSQDSSLGFVPTMGNLHPGHVSLFSASKKENTYSAASIFVNPTQFNNPNDFDQYPRTLESDLIRMQEAGIDFCLLPDEQAMYADNYQYQVQENQLSQMMEGLHRPGHFNGVLTVVLKLFNLMRPHQAYFGEKDYQQFLLIQGMVQALFLPIKVKACPTLREASKLAYSSRNNRLNPVQRQRAETFAQLFHQEKSCEQLSQAMEEKHIQVEYLQDYNNRRFAAVFIDEIRLIDNYPLGINYSVLPTDIRLVDSP